MYKITKDIKETTSAPRMKAGNIYEDVRLIDAKLEKEPNYSCIKLTFENSEGLVHEERIFPIGDKFFQKDKYQQNKIVGKETESEAKERTTMEWLTKMLHIGTKFATREEFEKATANLQGKTDQQQFEDFANKFINVLGNYKHVPLNIKLTVKYGTTYACFPKTVKQGGFIEVHEKGKPTALKFSNYELDQIKELNYTNEKVNTASDTDLNLDDLIGA